MKFQKKKSFGQHFLHDKHIIRSIADAVTLENGEMLVEIGPGEGALTEALLKRFSKDRLLLVEADRELLVPLEEKFGIRVVFADAARVDYAEITLGKPWVLVGNLPYNAAAAILSHALEGESAPREAIMMVQKEQGERMRAKPGEMSMLSLAIQLYSEPVLLFHVASGAFSPPPKVDSSVLRLTLKEKQGDEEEILALAKYAFHSRRKQVRKTLALALNVAQEKITSALISVGLREDIRPQDIAVEEWRQLREKLKSYTQIPSRQ